MSDIDAEAQKIIEDFTNDLTDYLNSAGPEATDRAQKMMSAVVPVHLFDIMFAINVLVHDVRNKSPMPDDQFVFTMRHMYEYVAENAKVKKDMRQ